MRKLFFPIVLFAIYVLSTGCVAGGAEDTENGFPPLMKGTIITGGAEYQMAQGGYKWERKQGLQTETVMTDHASPDQMAEEIEGIPVKPNEIIQIQIEDSPAITVYLWNEDGRGKEVTQADGRLAAPSGMGTYIYEVQAEWQNGKVSYVFVLDVS